MDDDDDDDDDLGTSILSQEEPPGSRDVQTLRTYGVREVCCEFGGGRSAAGRGVGASRFWELRRIDA